MLYFPENYFRIDELTGEIYNLVKLDLEVEPFATLSNWPINVKVRQYHHANAATDVL